MTDKQAYQSYLIEANKVESPTILLEDFNYFLTKAINNFANKQYNQYALTQQIDDNTAVLTQTIEYDLVANRMKTSSPLSDNKFTLQPVIPITVNNRSFTIELITAGILANSPITLTCVGLPALPVTILNGDVVYIDITLGSNLYKGYFTALNATGTTFDIQGNGFSAVPAGTYIGVGHTVSTFTGFHIDSINVTPNLVTIVTAEKVTEPRNIYYHIAKEHLTKDVMVYVGNITGNYIPDGIYKVARIIDEVTIQIEGTFNTINIPSSFLENNGVIFKYDGPTTETSSANSLPYSKFKPVKTAKSVTIPLPNNYYHLTGCTISYEATKDYKCYDKGEVFEETVKRLTTDAKAFIKNNYYLKPAINRPYFSVKNRLGNVVPDLEIETGVLPDSVKIKAITVDCLRTPSKVELLDSVLNDPNHPGIPMEFPEYICLEIINELVLLALENQSDPRAGQVYQINQSIAPTNQQQNKTK